MERSTGFDSDVIIYGFTEPLLAAQYRLCAAAHNIMRSGTAHIYFLHIIFLRRLHRDVTQQELDLL
jgi:hypothetical protein